MTTNLRIGPELKALRRELRTGLGQKAVGNTTRLPHESWELPKIEVSDPTMFSKEQISQLKRIYMRRKHFNGDTTINIGNQSDLLLDERKGIAFARYELPVSEENRYKDHHRWQDMGDFKTVEIDELVALKNNDQTAIARAKATLQKPFDRIRDLLVNRISNPTSTFAEMCEKHIFLDKFQPKNAEARRKLYTLLGKSEYIK